MIGLALITFVAILGQGLRSSFTDAVNKQFIGDCGVLSSCNPVTDKAARAVGAAPRVEAVSEIRQGSARVFGRTVDVSGVDRNLTKVIGIRWKRGSDAVPGQLGRNGAFVAEDYATSHDLTLGSPLRLETPTGEPTNGNSPFGRIAMSTPTYDASFAGLLGKTQEAERNRARPTPLTRAHSRSPDDSLGAGIGLDAGAR